MRGDADWFGVEFTFAKDSDGQTIEMKERKPFIGLISFEPEDKWVHEHKKWLEQSCIRFERRV